LVEIFAFAICLEWQIARKFMVRQDAERKSATDGAHVKISRNTLRAAFSGEPWMANGNAPGKVIGIT
jgi:hypothetical protein